MIHGSTVLRVGLGVVFAAFAVMQLLDPTSFATTLPAALQGPNTTTVVYLNAALDAFLSLTILFALLPRVAPLLGAAYLLLLAFAGGWTPEGVRDFGLGMACLSLVFIHEEHIPARMRTVMARLFSKR